MAVVQGLALAAIVLGMLALARPLGGDSNGAVRRAAGDVIFVLDLSRSMNAQDVPPSRLGAAKRAAALIASALPDDRVGLLVFGGTPFLSLPPTLDHSEFLQFLEAASSEDLPDAATNIEVAAQMTAETLRRESDVRFGSAVLLSDGEDVEGKLEEAVKALHAGNVQTYTVGVGTAQGTTIPERDAAGVLGTHHDFAGREVVTQMNEGNLRRIASQAGGRYVRWQGDASVQPVIDGLKQLAAAACGRASGIPRRSGSSGRWRWRSSRCWPRPRWPADSSGGHRDQPHAYGGRPDAARRRHSRGHRRAACVADRPAARPRRAVVPQPGVRRSVRMHSEVSAHVGGPPTNGCHTTGELQHRCGGVSHGPVR